MKPTAKALRILAQGEGRFLLHGHLDLDTVPEALKQGAEAFHDVEGVVLDLVEVDRVDSAGLALLVEWTRLARRRGGRIRFVNAPQGLRNLASVCGVDQALKLDD